MAIAGSADSSRVLLRHLREIMAAEGDAQKRLDRIVRLIAANMVAEVCSIYLRCNADELELAATEGLNPEAVHKTRLKIGEGLVGDIAAHARPLNLQNAQAHPLFAFKPETGEEVYHSLLGVPLVRGGRVFGVLVVQNRTMRTYTEEEVESLQTVAMVLTEMVASGALQDATGLVDRAATLPQRLEGRSLSPGYALGTAVLHEPRIEVKRSIAENIGKERDRLDAAVKALRNSVDRLLDTSHEIMGGESREILETYHMFAHDRGWIEKLRLAVDSGLTAEAAIRRVQEETRARMHEITDPYLRERLADLDDLTHRLYQHLSGAQDTPAGELPEDAILIARNMGPAELLDYDRSRLRGVVLEEGSHSSHVAIVARALQLPVMGRCEDATDLVDPGDTVIVDAEHAQVFIRPTEDVLEAFRQTLAQRERQTAKYAALRGRPAITRDGERISLNINAGLLVDLRQLDDTGADGIGLYRTELHFMVHASMPKVVEQVEIYRRILDRAEGRPVYFRTLDIGGDKILPYQADEREENPAMGWRAIRIAMDRPALLKLQLRALLRATAGRSLNVMFPMVAEVDEFRRARAILREEVRRAASGGQALPLSLKVGTMLEVPSLVWQLKTLLPEVDFVSVGSNDLLQFFFAADRQNERVSHRYDVLSPSALSLLYWINAQCRKAGKPVSFCGEMAGRPLEAMCLTALGYRSLSMNAGSVGPVKEMLLSLDVGALAAELRPMLSLGERSLRERMQEYAEKHGVAL